LLTIKDWNDSFPLVEIYVHDGSLHHRIACHKLAGFFEVQDLGFAASKNRKAE